MRIRNLIAGLFAVGLLVAQEPQPKPEDPADIIVRYNFVTAPVTVHDQSGNLVSGLDALDFELYDNGKLQKITQDVASHPISLVVAVQATSTMEQMLPNIRKIGTLFSPLVLGADGEVAVLAYDHRVQTMTGFTSDADKISAAFKNLRPGSTAIHLNDAALQALYLLRSRPKNRRRILMLIGETRDYGSVAKVRDVMTEAEFSDIVIYSVEVSHFLTSITAKAEPPQPNPIPPEARQLPGGRIGTQTTDAQNNMGNVTPIFRELFVAGKAIFVQNPQEVYTKFSGGKQFSYKTLKGLEEAISSIGEELHTQYLLTYLPNNKQEGGYHELEVHVLKQGLDVRTRGGYWAAAKPQ